MSSGARRPWLVALVVVVVGCAPAPEPTNPAGPAVCDGGPPNPSARVVRDVAVIGPSTQSVRRADDELFLVESGSNTVSRFDLEDESYEVLVDVGNERNPWDVAITDDELWITNYLANTVTVADRTDGAILAEIEHESFDGPSAIAVLDGRVYVTNVQYRGVGDHGAGSVTVVSEETRTVLGAISTFRQNPTALVIADERLLVVDSGVFSNDGRYLAGSEGAVEIWTPTADPTLPEVTAVSLPLVEDRAIGLPGSPTLDGDLLFLASATAPAVFIFDIASARWLRGSENPIRLYDTARNAAHQAAMGDDGILYVTAFNEDELVLVDTSCDRVLDTITLEGSSVLAGPQSVVPARDAAYIVLANAFELLRVDLTFP